MKKLLLSILFIGFISQAQIVNFPDPVFKSQMLSINAASQAAKDLDGNYIKIDANNDGEIQLSEALNVSYINLPTADDVTGIEAFANLIELNAAYNGFSDIDLTQMTDLEIFDASYNVSFTELDVSQNVNLRYLDIKENASFLGNLDLTQNVNLEHLDCELTMIQNLDLSQNINLTYLDCSYNLLYDLDLSENRNLEFIDISYNFLTSIDVTNIPTLEYFDPSHNDPSFFGIELDLSQNFNLQYVNATMESLTSINIKNGVQEVLDFDYAIQSLFICADLDDLPMLETHPDIANSAVISSYCDFEPGGNYNTIAGTVLYDINANGCDSGDIPLDNVLVTSTDGSNGGLAFVNSLGNYSLIADIGNFTVTPSIENPSFFNFTPASANVSFSDINNNTANQDFCITPSGTHSDVEITIAPIGWPEPGYDVGYQLVFRNKGNQLQSGTVNFQFQEDILDLIHTSITPDEISSGSLSWNYTDFEPFETRVINVILNLNSPMETPAVNIDNVLTTHVSISPIAGDENPNDNTAQLEQLVVGSFDPNNIICTEGAIVSPDMIGEYLHYTINFENTGTAAANFIVVETEIDESKYDLGSIQILSSSHAMDIVSLNNRLEFVFDAINLPPEGTGNIVFKIRSKDDLSIGDSVSQQANIFFDYNFPIETNLATTTFQTLSVAEFDFDNTIQLFPNPAIDKLTIKGKTSIETIKIYDIHGRTAVLETINDLEHTVDISSLSNGVYFVALTTKNRTSIEKLIKR